MLDKAADLRLVRTGDHNGGGGSSLDRAMRLRNARKVRDSLFGAAMFAEPNWDILLELYIAQEEMRPIMAADLCIAIDAGWPSVMRWIRALRSQGLIDGYPALTIAPDMAIALSRKGDEKMVAYLSATH